MTTIAELVVRLAADSADFRNDLEKAAGKANSFQRQLSRTFAVVGAAALGAGIAFERMARQAINTADEAALTAGRLGITTEALSRLRYAAGLADVAAQSFDTSLERFTRNLAEAAQGSGTAKTALETLGLSAEKLARMTPDQAFLDVADALQTIPNQAQRVQVAFDLFGRSGVDLVTVLQNGRGAIEAAGDKLERFGGVLSGSTAAAADHFNDNLFDMQTLTQGLVTQITAEMLPAFNAIGDRFLATAGASNGLKLAVEGAAGVFKLLAADALIAKAIFDSFANVISSVGSALLSIAQGEFRQAFDALTTLPQQNLDEMTQAVQGIKDIWTATADDLEASAPAIAKQLAAPIKLAGTEIDDAAEKIRQEIEGLITGLQHQVATFGMTSREIDIYRLGVLKAGNDNLTLARSIDATLTALEAQQALMEEGARVYEQTRTAAEQLDIQQTHLNELYRAGAIDYETYLRALAQSQEAYEQTTEAVKATAEETSVFWDEAMRNMQDFAGSEIFNLLQGRFDNIGDRFKALIDRMVAEALAAQLFEKLFGDRATGGDTGNEGWIGSAIGAYQAYAGGRATGGPVTAGRAYMVGERGPEIFAPNVSGQIIPNSAANDSGARAVTINAPISISAPQGRIGQESITQLQAGLYRAGLRSARRNG